MLKICVYLIIFCVGQCCGIIYHLNETEYERLPRLFDLENYEKCMEDSGAIYCVAHLELYTQAESDLYRLIQEYSEYTLKHYNYSKIDRGICVTRSCEPYARNAGLDINRDLRAVLEGCLNQTMINKYDLMARVYGMNCEKEKEKAQLKLDYLDYIFLGVFIIFVVLALIGSYSDTYTKDSDENHKKGVSGRDLLLCFSIPENYKKLTTVEQKDARLDIFKCVHAYRTIVTFAVLYAHTVLLIASGFTSDPHSFEKAYESITLRITFSGLNVVQVFFFITGMLLSYFMEVAAETHNMCWKMIPNIVFYRWWRLTPSAAMVVAFSATWMRHLGSGPLWNTCVTNGTSGQCRRFFWAHLFYFNNYIPEDTLCALQTWYIAADMQVFVVGVIIHFAIRNRSTSFKIKSLTSLLLLSMTGPALQVWWQDIDAFAMQKPEVYRTVSDVNLRNLHVLGHNNLSASIIGLATGYLIYFLQKNKVEYPNFKFFISVGVLVSTYAIAVPFHLLIEAPTARLMKLSDHKKTDKKLA
ncbi:jg9637 [Pararge aegeria aegeria]|uniref:Jg9637 protein n=1 Tax=Pararge aegeria aegeria TaxID=348720 RepID=A0A8S4RR94_9NEOP|nr:jg9637 [Pararge aegeria aegeria]